MIEVSKNFADFNAPQRSALRKTIAQCAKDTDFPVAKPYDFDHESFKYFALCLRSNVNLDQRLNGSKGVRSSVLGWTF